MSGQKIRLETMSKTSLKDFNIEEARGWTIDRLQQIEYRVNQIIIKHFKPEDKVHFEKILLHSSIMDIGSKLKILKNIKTVDKRVIEKIRTLSSIRNGFAHAPINEHISIMVSSGKQDQKESTVLDVETMIEVMNSQGEIRTKSAYEYLVEFWTLNKELRELI